MPTTTHYDPNFSVLALQTRTDESGTDVTDVDGPELRLPWSMYSEGVRETDHYEVTATGANMSVDVGSGTAFNDLAVVAGDTAGQGKYGVLLEASTVNLTVPAADLSNPRIDEVYLAVIDDPGTMVKFRLGYRVGDAGASPAAPGPDASWTGYLLLASVAVAAGETAITTGDITDARTFATHLVSAELADDSVTGDKLANDVMAALEVDGATEVGVFATSSTSYVTAATVNLTIPPSWNSWKCMAYATFYQATGSTGLGGTDFLIRIGGVDGQAVNVDVESGVAVGGYRTGITGSGSMSVLLRHRVTGPTITIADIYLYARAVRTS